MSGVGQFILLGIIILNSNVCNSKNKGSSSLALSHVESIPGQDINKLAKVFNELILLIGEDPNRSGLKDTALRAANAFLFLTSGYSMNSKDIVSKALFECINDEMVIVKDIELFSICEHHLLPFIGKCHVGYIPNGKIVGLSKIARIVDVYARRLQVQENLTQQIAESLMKTIGAKGVVVVIEAMHLCMMMRGVRKSSAITKTLATNGLFKEKSELKQEFMCAIGNEKDKI